MIEKFFLLRYLEKASVILRHLYALFFIIFGWVIFYFEDVTQMGQFIVTLFTGGHGLISRDAFALIVSYLPLLIAASIASLPLGYKIYFRVRKWRFYWLVEALVCAAGLVLCTATLVSQSYNPFLYFRF